MARKERDQLDDRHEAIEAVTYVGVNPVWATVIPVVKLATTPNSDEPSR